jgi:hypothetical protein
MVPRSVPWPNASPAAQNKSAKKIPQVDAILDIEEPPLQKVIMGKRCTTIDKQAQYAIGQERHKEKV